MSQLQFNDDGSIRIFNSDSRNILTFTPEEALNILELLQANKKKIIAASKQSKNIADLPTIAWKHKMIIGNDLYYHAHDVCEPNFTGWNKENILAMTENNKAELAGKYCAYCDDLILEGAN